MNVNGLEQLSSFLRTEGVRKMATELPTAFKSAELPIDIALRGALVRRARFTFKFASNLATWDALCAEAEAKPKADLPVLAFSDGPSRNDERLIFPSTMSAGSVFGFAPDAYARIASHRALRDGNELLIVAGATVTDEAGKLDAPGLLLLRSWNGRLPRVAVGNHTGIAGDAVKIPTVVSLADHNYGLHITPRNEHHMVQDPHRFGNDWDNTMALWHREKTKTER